MTTATQTICHLEIFLDEDMEEAYYLDESALISDLRNGRAFFIEMDEDHGIFLKKLAYMIERDGWGALPIFDEIDGRSGQHMAISIEDIDAVYTSKEQ